MSISRKSFLFFIVVTGTLLLTGCLNKQTPVEKIYGVLEKVVSSEKVFEEQQEPLVKLEKKEKEIYDKIISLGMKEFEEIKKLSDEALTIVDQRKEHMEKEQNSIKASETEFKTITPLIDEIEEPAIKDKAQGLYDIMIKRYDIHTELYEHYTKALQLDKELYDMFQTKDLQLEQLDTQITKINEVYEKVLNANERFNEKTKQYNDAKLSFYKETGLKVNIKDK